MKLNHKGFGVVEVIVIIVIVGLISAVGFLFWDRSQKAKTADTASQKTETETKKTEDTAKQPKYVVPEGYMTYSNEEFEISFSYPEIYGELSTRTTENGVRIAATQEPVEAPGPGITGTIRLYTREPADVSMNSRKYGPQIQLKDGKWIVTETNEADLIGNKVGKEYRDFSNKTIASQKNGSLTVYTFISADEGSETDSLVLTHKGKLHELQLPSFSDGLYGFGEKENDKTAFNTMLKNIRDSIRISN